MYIRKRCEQNMYKGIPPGSGMGTRAVLLYIKKLVVTDFETDSDRFADEPGHIILNSRKYA